MEVKACQKRAMSRETQRSFRTRPFRLVPWRKQPEGLHPIRPKYTRKIHRSLIIHQFPCSCGGFRAQLLFRALIMTEKKTHLSFLVQEVFPKMDASSFKLLIIQREQHVQCPFTPSSYREIVCLDTMASNHTENDRQTTCECIISSVDKQLSTATMLSSSDLACRVCIR